jgi:hypothetical protein
MVNNRHSCRRHDLLCCLGLLLAAAGEAATFTAGAAGDFASVQAAVDAALATGGSNQVRVRQGTYAERLVIPESFAGSLTVTGGWNGTFTSRSTNPALTVLDGGGGGPVLTMDRINAGVLRFEGLTFIDGASVHGGGAAIELRGDAEVALVNNRFVSNTATGFNASGGGLWAYLSGASEIAIDDNLFADNVAQSDEPAEGGGFYLTCAENSTFSISRNLIETNRAVSTLESGRSAGFSLNCFHAGSGVVSDNLIQNNEGVGLGQSFGYGASIFLLLDGGNSPTGTITTRRNAFLDNRYSDESAFADHVSLTTQGPARLFVTDTVIAGGNLSGPGISMAVGGTIRLTNVTITGHGQTGIFDYRFGGGAPSLGTFSLFNSIVFGNDTETDLTAFVESGFNLIGVDPLFVAPASNDYRLQPGSPAIDAGTNSPPGGLGPTDAGGLDRISGGTVDIGAFERQSVTGPDCSESGTALCLSANRFRVELQWESASGSGVGQAIELTADTGYFWFFDSANVEVVVKVLNACGGFDRFWVFAAGLTDVAVELTVRDTASGAVRTYQNPLGTPFEAIQDTSAFATCP